nr:hypothetical protein [Tanacetum cinerariifolium]
QLAGIHRKREDRSVSGRGVRVHPEGADHGAAEGLHRSGLRLRSAYRRWQQLYCLPYQSPVEVIEDLLEDIGLGNRMAYVVARRLLASEGDQLPNAEGPLAIRGTEGLVLSYAKCCTPIPGDPIV